MTNSIQLPRKPFDPRKLPLDTVLFWYTNKDAFTIRNSFAGTLVTGGLGVGKSKGARQTHIRAMLRAGYAGVSLCVKANERDQFIEWCKAEGRLDSLVVVSPENGHCLNFLEYELCRPGRGAGMTENIVQLFGAVMETSAVGGSNHYDPFWPNSRNQLLRNMIDLQRLAVGRLSLASMSKVVRSAPYSLDEVKSSDWRRRSLCLRLLERASRRQLNPIDRGDLTQTLAYWLHEFPRMADKMRSSIVAMFTSVADSLLRGRLREMFTGGTTFAPEMIESGKIFLIDIPTKEYHRAGLIAQSILKYLFQRYWESRVGNPAPWPCFLDVDEFQQFANGLDVIFEQTAREARVATLFVTQNLPNVFAGFSGAGGKAQADSLFGNIATKVFHSNPCPTTNQYAEDVIGKDWINRFGYSGGPQGLNWNSHEAYEPVVPATEFTKLRVGEAIVFNAGREWSAPETSSVRIAFEEHF